LKNTDAGHKIEQATDEHSTLLYSNIQALDGRTLKNDIGKSSKVTAPSMKPESQVPIPQ